MKFAVAVEQNNIHASLGECTEFLILSAEGQTILGQCRKKTSAGHVALLSFLAQEGVSALICGDIGLNTRNALQMIGISPIPGCTGEAGKAIENFLSGVPQGKPSILEDNRDEDPDDPLRCLHDCAKCTLGCQQ